MLAAMRILLSLILLLPLASIQWQAHAEELPPLQLSFPEGHLAWLWNEKGYHISDVPPQASGLGFLGTLFNLGCVESPPDLCTSGPLNPCGLGLCSMAGPSYTCACPAGTVSATRVDGTPTCVTSVEQKCVEGYTVEDVENCESIASSLGLPVTALASANPGLDCTKPLPLGLQICLGVAPQKPSCNVTTKLDLGDSCTAVAEKAGLSLDDFLSINPGLMCQSTYLLVGQAVCTGRPHGRMLRRLQKPPCGCTQNNNPVCGFHGKQYNSFCAARCDRALPVQWGQCPTCLAKCFGRVGEPEPACPSRKCKYPEWPPEKSVPKDIQEAARYLFPRSKYPRCDLMKTQCQLLCNAFKDRKAEYPTRWYNHCFGKCFGCDKAPCWGPWVKLQVGSSFWCLETPSEYCNGSDVVNNIEYAFPRKDAFERYFLKYAR